jgi:cell division protein ZapD
LIIYDWAIVSDTIIYEQPLNERIRTFMRLEYLFARVDKALQGETAIDHREAIECLLTILSVFERGDLKSELIKEIERLIVMLSPMEHVAGVDKDALSELLAELDQTLDALLAMKSGIGHALKENEFLYSIRQRASIPGGTCDFDLPAYHHWLERSSTTECQQQLHDWHSQFIPVRRAIEVSLKLSRQSVGFSDAVAEGGFYQRSLDSNQATQLIRVEVAKEVAYFPEISGGKHRVTVRFMEFDIAKRPQQVSADIPFRVSCCSM